MLVAVSVDMEGVSQLRNVRETFGCMPEYWQTGKPRLEADVAAACEGLLAGGASELCGSRPSRREQGERVGRLATARRAPRDRGTYTSCASMASTRCSRSAITPAAASTASSPTRTCPGCGCASGRADLGKPRQGVGGRCPSARYRWLRYCITRRWARSQGRRTWRCRSRWGTTQCDPSFRIRRTGSTRFVRSRTSARTARRPLRSRRRLRSTSEASMPNGRDVVDDMAMLAGARVGDVEFAVDLENVAGLAGAARRRDERSSRAVRALLADRFRERR